MSTDITNTVSYTDIIQRILAIAELEDSRIRGLNFTPQNMETILPALSVFVGLPTLTDRSANGITRAIPFDCYLYIHQAGQGYDFVQQTNMLDYALILEQAYRKRPRLSLSGNDQLPYTRDVTFSFRQALSDFVQFPLPRGDSYYGLAFRLLVTVHDTTPQGLS